AMTSVALAYDDELDDARLGGFIGGRDGAILCSGDMTALVLLRRLQRLGLRVPDDVRLAGVDGDDTGRLFGLTSARFASEALAEAAFATLRAQLAGGEPPRVVPLPFTLLPGDTT
nr:substrate-binding domain-containing protein [Planctomycetota bacterium]